jgi:hypothetical protein
MKPSRLVDVVNGGKPARVAWKSLRRQMDEDLERRVRRRGRWRAVKELLDASIDRSPSKKVDAYLLSARELLTKLARDTRRPMAEAECRGMAAALSIRLDKPRAARKSTRKAIDVLREAVMTDAPAIGSVARYFDDFDDRQYRRRYLGNELLSLYRYPGVESAGSRGRRGRSVTDRGTFASAKDAKAKNRKKAPTVRRPRARNGRASVPSWDEIVFSSSASSRRR